MTPLEALVEAALAWVRSENIAEDVTFAAEQYAAADPDGTAMADLARKAAIGEAVEEWLGQDIEQASLTAARNSDSEYGFSVAKAEVRALIREAAALEKGLRLREDAEMTPDIEAIAERHADCDAYCLVSIGHEGEALICDARILADALKAAEARLAEHIEAEGQGGYLLFRHESDLRMAAEADADALRDAIAQLQFSLSDDLLSEACPVCLGYRKHDADCYVGQAIAAHDARRQP